MAALVIGRRPLLLGRQDHRLALRSEHDAVTGVLEVDPFDLLGPATDGDERRFVDEVGEVGACEARRLAGEDGEIDAGIERLPLGVDAEDLLPATEVGPIHHDLAVDMILQGIREFARDFNGILITDTMLIAGINDDKGSLTDTADFLAEIAPRTAYIAVPTRPTTVKKVHATNEAGLTRAHEIFSARLPAVELLAGHEVGEFAYTGDARSDLLAVTAVHPMREADVRRLLSKDQADWSLVEDLLDEELLKSTDYEGHRYFLRPVRCSRD